jgi:hypothetical protein
LDTGGILFFFVIILIYLILFLFLWLIVGICGGVELVKKGGGRVRVVGLVRVYGFFSSFGLLFLCVCLFNLN